MGAKAALYACQDFAFMAKSSAVSFLVVFLPALLVSRLYFQTASALYLSGCLPTLVLLVVFIMCIRDNVSKMCSGAPGPWANATEIVAENGPMAGQVADSVDRPL